MEQHNNDDDIKTFSQPCAHIAINNRDDFCSRIFSSHESASVNLFYSFLWSRQDPNTKQTRRNPERLCSPSRAPVIDRSRQLRFAAITLCSCRGQQPAPGCGERHAQVVGTAVGDDKSLNAGAEELFNDQMTASDRACDGSVACMRVCAGVHAACEHLQALPVVFVQTTSCAAIKN